MNEHFFNNKLKEWNEAEDYEQDDCSDGGTQPKSLEIQTFCSAFFVFFAHQLQRRRSWKSWIHHEYVLNSHDTEFSTLFKHSWTDCQNKHVDACECMCHLFSFGICTKDNKKYNNNFVLFWEKVEDWPKEGNEDI